ncbi:unnamed protein product [Brassicogethes aeneus]|uniref:PHD-type domain-containing protein n=1 Tax=Brassicogethes aeneus TaxID=1431903 RepID=A0A9P0AR41_BRAAE|nr:unnamed protein product [Brassicogethes aeneus]
MEAQLANYVRDMDARFYGLLKSSKQGKTVLENTQNAPNEPDAICPGCDEEFTDPPDEDWIQCEKCEKWWHESCSNYLGGNYVCDFCPQ